MEPQGTRVPIERPCRAIWTEGHGDLLMSRLFQDIRYALRQLRKSPGFTLTAVLTLALGIGVTAAVYAVIQSVLLAPLPYPQPDRLVGVAFTFPRQAANAEQAGTSADFVRQNDGDFSSSAVMDDGSAAVNLTVNGRSAVQINAIRVSQGYFQTLGVSPMLGRAFNADEDRPNGPHAVILSNVLWRHSFNSDAGIVGRAVRINEETYTVVGVMPADFAVTAESEPGVYARPDIWRPLQLGPKDPGYDGDNYEMIARLRDGVSMEQAQQHLNTLAQPFYAKFPNYKKWFDATAGPSVLHQFRVWPLRNVMVSQVRRSLLILMGAMVAVLLVACLNLAGLMIARALRRQREIGVRSALGATRGQLVRLMAAEGALLALAGGVLALLVARVASEVLMQAAPLPIPKLSDGPNAWLMAVVVLGIAVISTAAFSTLPAWLVLRRSTREIRLGGASLGQVVSHARISRLLLVAQVAIAMVLVSTASVLLGTFVRLRALPSGIEPKQLAVFQTALKGDHYASTRQTMQFVTSVMNSMSHVPGVESVAAVNGLPLDRGLNMGGYPADRRELERTIEVRTVTPGYFATMGMHLLAGRDIADSDQAKTVPVVVIGETAAKRWWPGRSPVGEMVRLGNERNWRIVGVVSDVQMHSLVEAQGIVVYAPMAQQSDEMTGILNGWFSTSFAIRTAGGVQLAAAAQQAVSGADPEIPIARFTAMQAVIDSTIDEPRFLSLLAGGFSGFALLLTVIGIFGLLSYQVTQRTREIGVRMALGADRGAILRTILGRGLAIASLGVVAGVAGAYFVAPVISHLLADTGVAAGHGAPAVVMNSEVATAIAAGAILAATFIASLLPARRAARIEPMQALRTE